MKLNFRIITKWNVELGNCEKIHKSSCRQNTILNLSASEKPIARSILYNYIDFESAAVSMLTLILGLYVNWTISRSNGNL
jgi:hypothetical protein